MCRKLKTITHYLYLFKIIKCLVQESKCMMRFKVYDVYDNHCTELEAKRKYTSKVFTLRIGGMHWEADSDRGKECTLSHKLS